MSHSLNINTQEKYIYFISNILLFFFKPYILLSDGTKEFIIKKTEITQISNRYYDSINVYNRYIISEIMIECTGNKKISVFLNCSPQSTPGERGFMFLQVNPDLNATIDTRKNPSIKNGNNTTTNAFIVTDSITGQFTEKIGILTAGMLYHVNGLLSFYKALQVTGLDFPSITRIDYDSSTLISNNIVYSSLGQKLLPYDINAVLRLESYRGLVRDGDKVSKWLDSASGNIFNANNANDKPTINGFFNFQDFPILKMRDGINGLLEGSFDADSFTMVYVAYKGLSSSLGLTTTFTDNNGTFSIQILDSIVNLQKNELDPVSITIANNGDATRGLNIFYVNVKNDENEGGKSIISSSTLNLGLETQQINTISLSMTNPAIRIEGGQTISYDIGGVYLFNGEISGSNLVDLQSYIKAVYNVT